MTGPAHLGLAVLALDFTAAVLLIRWAVTPPTPRVRRPRPVEEWVPAYTLVPARSLFAHCPPCGGEVSVTVHGRAHRCDHGHLTLPSWKEAA